MEMVIQEYDNYNCYVINLKRCPLKKQFITNQLQNNDIEYSVFEAIDGNKIDDSYFKENDLNYCHDWKEPNTGRMITLGEIGCALSHYFIYQLCIKDPYDITLILEDDAVLQTGFNEQLQNIINELKNIEWDICYLGRKKMKDDLGEISDYLVTPNYSYWTVGYLINKQGAQKICNSNFSKNILTIDEFLPIIGDISPFSKKYNTLYHLPDFKIVSAKNLIINPKNDAFQNSSTEISKFPNAIKTSKKLLILAVGTDMNHGLQRFIHSCKTYGLQYRILGLHQKWKGGNMAQGMGGGMKINFLKTELLNLHEEQLIFFSDSYDVIMAANEDEIIENFHKFNTPLVFAAERSCWPDTNLKTQYPNTTSVYPYLNSGGFMGTVKDILDILQLPIQDSSDDQLYYSQAFLKNPKHISLDYKASIFQTLNFSRKDITINTSKGRVKNILYNTYPCQIHGNGDLSIKIQLNSLGNYLSRNWNNTYGYLCPKKMIRVHELPNIFLSLYIKNNINVSEILHNITQLQYPKNKIQIHIFTKNIKLTEKINTYSIEKIHTYTVGNEPQIRDHIITEFINSNCSYWLHVDTICNFTNMKLIQSLLSYNKDIIAPYLPRGNEYYSNFWGDIDSNGFYKRSFDYYDISEHKKTGCWNVPYINHCYLVNRNIVDDLKGFYSKNFQINKGHDMAWCDNLRSHGYFMHVANEEKYGVLINEEMYPKENLLFDMYLYKNNENNWAKKYFHPNFYNSIGNWKKLKIESPLCDVIEFPLFNETFCKELIEISESYCKWSGAQHNDARIGYENVPTNDIHLSEMNLRNTWNAVVLKYIAPLVSYYWSPFKTKGLNISFVVKYVFGKFHDLKPHHDSSTYSIVITLNKPGIDFKGGGTRFVKQNVTIPGKLGYATIHPGRLTHYHEGLPITEGNRYLFVSFVD